MESACYKKIVIENVSNESINIKNIEQNKTIYIVKCKGVNINIEAKINNIYLEDCENINIKFNSIINKFDVYDCKNIFFRCKGDLPLIVSEKVSLIKGVIEKDILQTLNIICMTTYEFDVYSSYHKKCIEVKHGMFDDRFRTYYDEEYKPIMRHLKKNSYYSGFDY